MNAQYEEIIDNEETTLRQYEDAVQELSPYQELSSAQRFLNISIASIQAGMAFLIEILPRAIVYLMLARINKPDLIASIGLGNIFIKSLTQGANIGISYGLEILVSQAYGAKEFELCGQIYYRSLFSTTFFMLPIILLHLCSIYFYKIIIEDIDIINNAYMYTMYMLFAVWLNAIYGQTKVFLNGQNIYNYQLYTQSVSCFVNVLLQYLFIIHLNLGLIGYVFSQTLAEIFSLIVLLSFIIITKCSQTVLVYCNVKEAIKNSFKFFITAFPIGAIVWVEMLCFQIYSLQAGYLSTKEFTTFIILLNVILISYSFSLGIGIAAATFVGNEMGRKNINEAQKLCLSSLIVDVVFQSSLIVLIILYKRPLSIMITDDSEIQFYLEDSLPLVCLIMMLDGLQVVLSSIVRAIGKARYASHTFIICYIFIGNLVAYYLLHWKQFDAKGIWIGVSIGIFLYDSIQVINIIWNDWRDLIKNIHSTIKGQKI